MTDDEGARTLGVSSASVDEGGEAQFTVTLSGPVASTVTVDWATENRTATAPEDYATRSGTLTFRQGDPLTQTVTVQTVHDERSEGDEIFQVRLSNVQSTVSVAILSSPATGTIVDGVVAAAQARGNRVNEEALPEVARAMSASVLSQVTERIESASAEAARSGGSVSLAGSSSLYHALKANERALEEGTLDLARLLGGSSFTLPLSAAEDGGRGPLDSLALWASGDYRNLSGGQASAVEWEGDILSAHLGSDVRLREDLLVGLSVAWSQGMFDYTDRTDGRAQSGTYENRMTSLNPYVGWKTPGGISLWGALGYGWGELEIDDNAEGIDPQSSDLTQRSAAVGANGTVYSSDNLIEGGTTSVRIKSQASLSRVHVEGNGAASDAVAIHALTVDVHQVRLALEGSHAHALAAGGTLTPALELGLRHDGGDGETGAGIELGGSLRYENPAIGLIVEGRGRTLLAHGGDYEEWGFGGLVRLGPGTGGLGPHLSLVPAWGETQSGVRRLWNDGATGMAANDDGQATPQGRLEAQLGYGLGVIGGAGVLTPYGGFSLSGEGAGSYTLGTRLEIAPSLNLSLEGTRREAANDDADHGVMLQGQLRF